MGNYSQFTALARRYTRFIIPTLCLGAFSSVGSFDPEGNWTAAWDFGNGATSSAINPSHSYNWTAAWDFGDGANSSAINPSHSYASTGNYTLTLTVTDQAGRAVADTAMVTVTAGPDRTPLVIPTPGWPTFGEWWILLTFPIIRRLIDIPPERPEIWLSTHIKLVPVLITLMLVAFTGTLVLGNRWPHRFPNRRAASLAYSLIDGRSTSSSSPKYGLPPPTTHNLGSMMGTGRP